MFPSFVLNPTHIHFEGQDPDENIILLLRSHPIMNLVWFFQALLVFIIPFLVPPLLHYLQLDFLSRIPAIYISAFIIIDTLLVLIIVFEGFLHWYFNVYIVTTKRIMDVEFSSVLAKNIDLAPLTDVQEANSKLGGIIRGLFNFGDVTIATAAARIQIDFRNIPQPDRVADFIMDQAGA